MAENKKNTDTPEAPPPTPSLTQGHTTPLVVDEKTVVAPGTDPDTTPPEKKKTKEAEYIVTATMLGTRHPDTLDNLVQGDVVAASVFGDALERYKATKSIRRYTTADKEAAAEAAAVETAGANPQAVTVLNEE